MARIEIPDRLCELMIWFHEIFPAGNFLHIVTDDDNWETHHIVWCMFHWLDYTEEKASREWLIDHEKEIRELCTLILEIPEKHRCRIWGAVERFRKDALS